MMLRFRSCGKLIRFFLLLSSFAAVSAVAQDYGSMGISDVVGAADSRLQRGDYAGAIAPLEEVIRRIRKTTENPQELETLQGCRFQLARSFYQIGDSASGMEILEDYLEQEPRKQERMALRLMAQGFFETEKWEQIEKVAGRLLGLEDLEPEDILNANLLLGQALFRQEKWVECIKPLSFTANNSKDERTQGLTQIMIVRALVESENWRELFGWIPRLYRTDSKYDITLNLTLMKAGKARFDQDDYLNSLLLYRMVLPRDVLVDFANGRISRLAKKLAADVKIGIKDSEQKERQAELDAISDSMKILNDLPPYEDEVTFRIGQIYAEVKRYWEGFVLFDKLYEQDRTSDIGEAAMLQSVLILYDVQEFDRAEGRILRYLDERIDGQYARTLLSMMIRDNLVKQNLDKVISLRKYIEALPATSDENDRLLGADLHYMTAFGYFQRKDYKEAGEQFSVIIDKYPNAQSLPDSTYYRGMTYMLQGDYQGAINDFLLYQQKYTGGEHYPASMFRQAVCLFGMENIVSAEAAFTKFINAYPDNALVSEAYSMRGDIEAAKDGKDNPDTPEDEYDPHTLDRALADYRKAIDSARAPLQSSYAAFQAAKVYKLEFKWQEIIDLMDYYMGLWADKADVAQAVFWIGQSQIELGQVEDAVTAYLNAIENFGNEVEQEGVDKIVIELVSIADIHLSDEDRQGLSVRLKLKQTSVDERAVVFKLRLRVAMAHLEGEEAVAALGSELLSSQENLSITTPISLAIMCDAAVTEGDAAKMGVLFDYFLTHFEDSDELWHAYRAKTYQLLAANDYEGVLEVIDESQGLFGADSFMGWAQIILADTLFKMKRYEDAEKAFNMVMGVGEWRGALYAEAMYGMGQCRLALGDFKTAHSFFQRTYLLFKGYEDGKWAADGYLAAAAATLKLGSEEDAIKTWRAMLEDEYVNTLPQAEIAREMLKKYGGAL